MFLVKKKQESKSKIRYTYTIYIGIVYLYNSLYVYLIQIRYTYNIKSSNQKNSSWLSEYTPFKNKGLQPHEPSIGFSR